MDTDIDDSFSLWRLGWSIFDQIYHGTGETIHQVGGGTVPLRQFCVHGPASVLTSSQNHTMSVQITRSQKLKIVWTNLFLIKREATLSGSSSQLAAPLAM